MTQIGVGLPLPYPEGRYHDWKEWAQEIIRQLQAEQAAVRSLLNGRLGFGDGSVLDNVEGAWLLNQVTDPVADTDKTFSHNIGRTPVGFIVVDRDKPGVIYRTSWSANTITLRSNLPSVTFTAFVIAPPADV